MGSLFRSEEMCLAQLYLQSEAAFACVSELGELGLVQFIDLNENVNAFQRKYVNEVRRCDEMERKLRFLEKELKKDEIEVFDNGDNPLAPAPREMIDLEVKFEKLENDMKEINTNQGTLKRNFLELTEMKQILLKAQIFFDEAKTFGDDQGDVEGGSEYTRLVEDTSRYTKVGFVAGVILREKLPLFEKILWRACRGNVFLRHAEIDVPLEDPLTGDLVQKSVFLVFFQGDQLQTRVRKICEGLHATVYPCPDNAQERKEIALGVMTRIEDLQTVLNQTEDHRRLVLSQVSTNIRTWFIKIRKIKAIYHTLNLFNVNIAEKCLIAKCWCPVKDLGQIQEALRNGTETSGSSVPSILQQVEVNESPPTYNRTNSFSSSFQGMIDAFGVATYQEVNPAPFTIITFPFLFAVMFGDLGHGFLMFLTGLYLVVREKHYLATKSNEIFEMVFGGRYIILLMGAFSMYTGFLYNECFSRSLNVFGSAWNVSALGFSDDLLRNLSSIELNPDAPGVFRGYPNKDDFPYANGSGDPYPYGMDPIWQSAENKITFENSYKMKSAIIFGMTQMFFGLTLSLFNHLYFKNKLAIFCEWIPQMLFLWCIVGYMCIIIIYKWIVWKEPSNAPSLLIGLINMFMFTPPSKEQFTWLYEGQGIVQIVVVLLTITSLPWMLLAKPGIIYYRRKLQARYSLLNNDSPTNVENPNFIEQPANKTSNPADYPESGDTVAIVVHDQLSSEVVEEEEEEEVAFSEIMILQIIHTIEFSLSCISHTASYLRLWALSLAHSELSEVLWTMVMHIGLASSATIGPIVNFLTFIFFALLTIGILLIMEGLSAFLHALRLHWVEFQSKFYQGEGYIFAPFSFTLIVEGNVEE